MKKATYDKSGIMKEAWNLFNNDDITTADFEYLTRGELQEGKTFAVCLKEAWAHAEHSVQEEAWDWACKKLGVSIETFWSRSGLKNYK